jgi:hypothetical protein
MGQPAIGQYFGTGGCGPSVGVLIYAKQQGWIAVFHFNTIDSPGATIGQYDWKARSTPLEAVICGGDEEPESIALLNNTREALAGEGIKIVGYNNSANVYIGRLPGDPNPQYYCDVAEDLRVPKPPLK